ncbi:phosphatase PAP2 family protein [Vibrio rarus]|uniref:phosphatase PAP2 family protein n=1 Tax=Vibrio rarus TaxID=413403 RepID=UPI0021C36145|nr:phosphatase PAP2 family protein [Vibrio rarus]
MSGKNSSRHNTLIKVVFINVFFLLSIGLLFKSDTNTIKVDYYLYLSTLLNGLLFTLVIDFSFTFISCAIKRESSPLRFIFNRYLHIIKSSRLINALIFITLFMLTTGLYTSIKVHIPQIQPFDWDTFFVNLDNSIHFGFEPWVITHWLASSPYATLIINVLYNLWFFVLWVFFILVAFSSNHIKYQSILTFNLCWLINGIIFAIFFSSAGPCFYSQLSIGDNTYIDLMNRLNAQDEFLKSKGINFGVAALYVQDYIWDIYISGKVELGSGISAFPSMHVSIATVIAITCFTINKKLGMVMWVYTLIILFGSVHLGWHYAVDGYFSIISSLLIWIISGRLLNIKTFSFINVIISKIRA